MYAVGLDVGATFTTVAIWRDGEVAVLPRDGRAPSRVLVAPNGRLIAGAAAERYLDNPAYVALNGVVGKLGEPGPIVAHGLEFSVEGVVAALLRGVVADIHAEQSEPPAAVTICHPADWGTFTTNLLSWAVTLADLRPRHGVQLITVPEAVAVEASRHIDIPPGALFGVQDFGGRSFTAAVMRRTAEGFDTLGDPVRLPDLGGHDVDEALLRHVIAAAGRDREARSVPERSLAVLREACRAARSDLLTDVTTRVAVALPGDATATQVPVSRAELDDLTRPMLTATLDALRRSSASAGVSVGDFEMVLMIGGATDLSAMAAAVWDELRIPPVVLDQPELAAARGAAWVGGGLALAGAQALVDGAAVAADPLIRDVPGDSAPVNATVATPPSLDPVGVEPSSVESSSVEPVAVAATPWAEAEPVTPPLPDPALVDPAPLDPAPLDPAPLDPAPLDPAPADPAPLDPAPLDPAPLDPAPLDPAPLDPAPLDPAPLDPAPLDQAPLDQAPLDQAPLDTSSVGPSPAGPHGSSALPEQLPSRRRVVASLLAVAAGLAVLVGLGTAAFLVVRDDPVAAGTCPAAQADGPWVCVTSAAVVDGRLTLSLTTHLSAPASVIAAVGSAPPPDERARVQLFGSGKPSPTGRPAGVIDVGELAAELSLDYSLVAEPRAARIADLPFVCARVVDASGEPLVRAEPTVDCAPIAASGEVDATVPPAAGRTPAAPVDSGTPTSQPPGTATQGPPQASTPGGRSIRGTGTARKTSPPARRPSSTPQPSSTASIAEPAPQPGTPDPGPPPSSPPLPPTDSGTSPPAPEPTAPTTASAPETTSDPPTTVPPTTVPPTTVPPTTVPPTTVPPTTTTTT